MKLQLFFLSLTFSISSHYAQQLEEVNLPNSNAIIYGEAFWIDKNNDNQSEIFVTGSNNNYNEFSSLFNYSNNQFETDIQNTFQGLNLASADKADFNNDGFTDIIMTGNNGDEDITKLYLNDSNGLFIEQTTNFKAATNGRIRTADLNNDTFIDVVLTGYIDDAYGAYIYYQDSSGNFTEATSIQLMENYFGDITFIDFNNDAYTDLIITGFDSNYSPNTKVYQNNEGDLTEITNHNIDAYYFSNTAVYDIDNDGDDDFLISGSNSSYTGETSLYLNNGAGVFAKKNNLNIENVYFGDLSFVDFNMDTFQDIFITGQDSDGSYVSNLYLNDGLGNFTINQTVSDQIINVAISTCDWRDMDNDNDPDLVISGLDDNGDEQIRVYKSIDDTASVVDNSLTNIRLYPNPTNGKLFVDNSYNLDIKEIRIFNSLGQLVDKEMKSEINLSTMPNGVYFVEVIDENNHKIKKQIIKN